MNNAPAGMTEHQEFTCPECGAHAFGTSQVADGVSEGHCHGYKAAEPAGRHATTTPAPCMYTWPRTPAGDAAVFKGTGHYSPTEQTGTTLRPSRPGT